MVRSPFILEAHLTTCLEEPCTLSYRRTFAAPRSVVWSAWTSPQKMDVRPGGQWRYTMHGPDGTDYENLITYQIVEEPSRLIDDHGEPGFPNQFHVTVTFTEGEGGTHMDYQMVFPTKEDRDNAVERYGAVEGSRQNMDRFEAWLSETGLVVTRILSAPLSATFWG